MIKEIRDRLLTDGTPFALVEGTVALAQVKDRPPVMPAAYVFPLRSSSSENQRATGGTLQNVAEDIGVVIIFENLAAPLGDPGADELEQILRWVRTKLLGFVFCDENDPLEHVSGELVKARSGVVWWQETFGTAHILESDE